MSIESTSVSVSGLRQKQAVRERSIHIVPGLAQRAGPAGNVSRERYSCNCTVSFHPILNTGYFWLDSFKTKLEINRFWHFCTNESLSSKCAELKSLCIQNIFRNSGRFHFLITQWNIVRLIYSRIYSSKIKIILSNSFYFTASH